MIDADFDPAIDGHLRESGDVAVRHIDTGAFEIPPPGARIRAGQATVAAVLLLAAALLVGVSALVAGRAPDARTGVPAASSCAGVDHEAVVPCAAAQASVSWVRAGSIPHVCG